MLIVFVGSQVSQVAFVLSICILKTLETLHLATCFDLSGRRVEALFCLHQPGLK